MKVQVDAERCQGHTMCAMIAPDVFELSEIDGHSSVVLDEIPEHLRAKVLEAAQSCPERAITVS